MNKEVEIESIKSSFGPSLFFSLGFYGAYLVILFLILIIFFRI